jgi:hypothetical protein
LGLKGLVVVVVKWTIVWVTLVPDSGYFTFRFIEKFGTHIVVGVKMGGKDVIYLKQQHSSSLQPALVQKRLKEMSDRRFLDAGCQYDMNKDAYGKDKVLSFSV